MAIVLQKEIVQSSSDKRVEVNDVVRLDVEIDEVKARLKLLETERDVLVSLLVKKHHYHDNGWSLIPKIVERRSVNVEALRKKRPDVFTKVVSFKVTVEALSKEMGDANISDFVKVSQTTKYETVFDSGPES